MGRSLESDFLMAVDRKPWFAVEAKRSEENVTPSLRYFHDRLKIPWAYQLTEKPGVHKVDRGVTIVSADRFLGGLV